MSIWTTIGSVVAAIGAGGAQLFDRLAGYVGASAEQRKAVAFTVSMIALSAKMAKADGVVTADEVLAFRELFAIPQGEERNVARLFDLAKEDVAGFESYAQRIYGLFAEEYATRQDILDGLFHIAKADGVIHEDELAFLERVAEIFGMEPRCFSQILARHTMEGPDPYMVLGITPEADDDAVKKRYREQVRQTHPDQMIARGVPEEFVKIANDRLVALNEAWGRICVERGL